MLLLFLTLTNKWWGTVLKLKTLFGQDMNLTGDLCAYNLANNNVIDPGSAS